MENKKQSKFEEFYNDDRSIKYSITQHLSMLLEWTKSPSDIINEVLITHLAEIKSQYDSFTISSEDLLLERKDVIIYGEAGSGKTTLVKQLIRKLLNREAPLSAIPLLIRGMEISDGSLVNQLCKIFNISAKENVSSHIPGNLVKVLSENEFVIFIDGLDEIYLYKSGEYDRILNEITDLSKILQNGNIIATSRRYAQIQLETFAKMEILPLTEDQIKQFVNNNTNNNELYYRIKELYPEFLRSPILISQLILIFNRFHTLPTKHVLIYRNFVNTMLEEWDEKRNKTSLDSISFNVDSVYNFLSFFAFTLILNGQHAIDKRVFINTFNESILFDTSYSFKDDTLIELLTSTGIVKETSDNYFSFIHLTILEFFAANYLVKLPKVPPIEIMKRSPNTIALCILLSSNPILYLRILIDEVIKVDWGNEIQEIVISLLFSTYNDSSQKEKTTIEKYFKGVAEIFDKKHWSRLEKELKFSTDETNND